MAGDPILQGVRVLDFGRYVAGPYCAAILADLGADVIRIDKVGGSEDRYLIPVAEDGDGDGGALYQQVNRNKRGMTLDPLRPGADEVIRRLVATADVVVANLPDRALRALGLDEESVRSIRPDIVLTSVSAFGPQGPWADRSGFDGIGQAMSGAAFLSGEAGMPSKSYMLWVDFATAAFAALGTVAALYRRQDTGRGGRVDGSLLSTALTVANSALMEEALTGVGRVATGNRAQVAGPADIFPTTDGWIIVQVVGAGLFRRWADLVGRPDLVSDPRYATDRLRGDHRNDLCSIMARWCALRSTDTALAQLAEAGVPAGPVLSPAAALAHPQIEGAGVLHPVLYPGNESPAPVAELPVRVRGSARSAMRRAPRLGEHTDEILADAGFTPTEVQALRRRGII